MNVNAYLNELSVETSDVGLWVKSFDNVMSCMKAISNITHPTVTIIHARIFLNIVAHPNLKFTDFLNNDKDRKRAFQLIFRSAFKNFLFLDPQAKYFIGKKDVGNSSAADSYESNKSGACTFLINFSDKFPSPLVDIEKEIDGLQTVMSYCDFDKLTAKLKELRLIPDFYDKNSSARPNETQTILNDTTLFIPTKFGNRNNRLYRRIGDEDQLWCLDRGHRGNSIHLEVFSESQKKQIAVSRHDAIDFFRNLNASEKNRKLNMIPMP